MANFTALCLGLFIRGRKGGERARSQTRSLPPTTSPADTTSSGDQDSLCPLQSRQLCLSLSPLPPTSRSGVDKTFLSVAVNRQILALPGSLNGRGVMRSQKQGWGWESPFHQDMDALSQNPLKAGRVSQGPQPSSVLTSGPKIELRLDFVIATP